jgi:ZIP family zinc transporter
MASVAWWSFVGAFSLVVGSVIGLRFRVSPKVVGLVMGFGAGTLLSAVSFDLLLPAYGEGGAAATVIGMLVGALTFMGGDVVLERHSRREERRRALDGADAPPIDPVVAPRLPGDAPPTSVSGPQLVLGALLDGVPESVAIGITILLDPTGAVSVAMVAAVFLSNVPEGLSGTVGLREEGRGDGLILAIWGGVVAISVVATVIGYALLGNASNDVIAVVQAFAAGAILAMLSNTMMPEAYGNGGRLVGLLTVVGFILASGLTTLS